MERTFLAKMFEQDKSTYNQFTYPAFDLQEMPKIGLPASSPINVKDTVLVQFGSSLVLSNVGSPECTVNEFPLLAWLGPTTQPAALAGYSSLYMF